ncbi:MAG: HAMP domain-containing histidine kinase [Bacteroidales bacterium]|jgi:signal transduction histidine kinase|nr:HAMP domain-containing histidine kinase [Bacteroidales bacterium]
MKKDTKQRRIMLLMIVTQLILTIFVVYWLRTQYLSSKGRLENELSEIYIRTQDELIDTLVFKSFVNPVISGKVITVNIGSDNDSLAHGPDSLTTTGGTEEMILRSVRMIVSHTDDSTIRLKSHFSGTGFTIDSAMFDQRFHLKMNEEGMNFRFRWTEAPGDSAGGGSGRVIMMEPMPGSRLPGAEISGFKGYIMMEILPQLGFGLFLVLLSSLAFLLAYRYLRDHAVLNELRNEFIGNMTHELKTPVATLRVALEALEKYSLRDEPELLEEYLRLASLETTRLEELINRVLDHSLLENNGSTADMKETEINSLAGDAVDLMKIRLAEGSVTFHRFATDIKVVCDRLYIKSVLLNLIDNSLKYCGTTPEVNLLVRQEGRYAVIEVRDNGPGIPREYQEKVFEKFFRLPAHNVHNVKGYGLGLSFAQLVVRLHGGRIEIRNHNPGCSFIIYLPSV